MNLKSPLTYEEQIERLKSVHNLLIDNVDVAKDILKRVNYYRLSAYGIGLKKTECPEEFVDGTSLDDLYKLYVFDSKLKNIWE